MKTISIILSKQKGAKFIYWVTGRKYTHAAIGLEESNTFYSFNLKGFSVELPKLYYSERTLESKLYKIQVTDEVYENIREAINKVMAKRENYKYSYVGVLLCILGIPHKFNDAYFCSQFVAELLINAGVLPSKTCPALFLPNKIEKVILKRIPYKVVESF